MRTSLLRLVVVLACLCLPWAAEGKTRRLAVVVGNNSSQEAGLEALKFADDDAMQYAWFFRFVADEVWLHVRPDEESAAMHPNEETAGPPTRDAVLATLDAAVEKAQAWADAGDEVVVYLLFSGHGSYDAEGKGFLHLEDGKLTTRDLFYHLIGRTEDFFAVLVIDACNAGFLVKSKGPGRRAAGETTLEIEQYGNVGLVLASSPTGEVREWGRYLAGIFSHQVRSALSGAADVDADGKVSFQELASFVEAANRAVTNPALKLTPYIRPPLSRPGLPLVDFSDALFTQYLSVQLDHAGKVAVYDQELVRVADFHLDAGVAAKVALAGTGEHFVAVDGKEYRVPAGTRGTVALGDLAVDEEPQVAVRGVDEYYSKHLFAIPYSPEFARQ